MSLTYNKLTGFSYMPLTLDSIREYFYDPPPIYLNNELATCYVVDSLIDADSYGTELIQTLERNGDLRIADAVLYTALKFLEANGYIEGYWKTIEGQSRPRRVYTLLYTDENIPTLDELSTNWQHWLIK